MNTPQGSDIFRNSLAFFLISAFVGVIPLLFFVVIPKENEQIITYMAGQLSGMALMALGFYFTNKAGQDALDAKRSETTGKLADAMTATANASGVGDGASKAADAVAEAAVDKAAEVKGEPFRSMDLPDNPDGERA